jgi:hypothetical protein
MKILTISLMALCSSFAVANDDGAFLDGKYTHLIHPKISTITNKALAKNDVVSIIMNQSPVKSQAARGTCSIFSATAYLEGQLIAAKKFDSSINLSEEWLEYIALRGKTSDGSSAPTNFNAFYTYGMASEQTMPYIGEDWTEAYNPLKETRCGHLTNESANKACLIVHRDPKLLLMTDIQIISTLKDEEFMAARKEALELKLKYLRPTSSNYYLWDTNAVKETLVKGKPVILEIDFYYGAWNHRKADEYGIGRDTDQWAKGIVTNPEPGSMDAQESVKHPAGHSVLVVGFDDNKIVKKKVLMADGTTKTFTYKGVYYFKNSWGSSSFGANFEVEGQKFPGYGMIVQKHADEQGSFFILPQ